MQESHRHRCALHHHKVTTATEKKNGTFIVVFCGRFPVLLVTSRQRFLTSLLSSCSCFLTSVNLPTGEQVVRQDLTVISGNDGDIIQFTSEIRYQFDVKSAFKMLSSLNKLRKTNSIYNSGDENSDDNGEDWSMEKYVIGKMSSVVGENNRRHANAVAKDSSGDDILIRTQIFQRSLRILIGSELGKDWSLLINSVTISDARLCLFPPTIME